MKKIPLLIGLVTLALIVGGAFLFSKPQNPTSDILPPTSYEYFWGDGCPHCANVEDFMKTWTPPEGVEIKKLEVWSNRNNANLMRKRAVSCSLNTSRLGVPFLVTPEGKCIEGDEAIIDLFKSLNP